MVKTAGPEAGGFSDPTTATWFRDVLGKHVLRVIDKARPPIAYGTVTEINPDINSCMVLLNGDDTPVEVKFGGLRPTSAGVYVRVAGPRGDRYLDGIMGGAAPTEPDPADFDAPANFELGPTIYGVHARWDPVDGAQFYEVEFADDNTFTTGTRSYVTSNREFNEQNLVAGTVVWGRVRATTSYGSAGPWSDSDDAIAQGVTGGDVATDGNPPVSSPTVTVSPGLGFLHITWGLIGNNDPVTYEVHLSETNGFTPSSATLQGETSSGFWLAHLDQDGMKLDYDTVYFVRVVAKDADGAAPPGGQDSGSPLRFGAIDVTRINPDQVGDGNAPASSPAPTITNGLGYLYATWTPLATDDYTVYDVHVSTVNGFTPSSATLVGGTPADFFFIRKVGPGAGGGALVYGTLYYVKLIARDVDGQAAASAQASGTPFQITDTDITPQGISTPSLAANTITAASGILADLAVATAKIQDAAIVSAKIAGAAIQTAHIGDAQILSAKIADAAIVNAKIQDAAINNAKIDNVSASKLTAGTIAAQNIALGSGGQIHSGSALVGGSGFVLNDQGFSLYNSGGIRTVHLDATDGSADFTGNITGSNITGGVITGALVQTASGSGARARFWGGTSPLGSTVGLLELFSGGPNESAPGTVWAEYTSGNGDKFLGLHAPQHSGGAVAAIYLNRRNSDGMRQLRLLGRQDLVKFNSMVTIETDFCLADVSLMTVAGDFNVTGTKSFAVDHPVLPDKTLKHCALEGPEPGIIYRGRGSLTAGEATIALPDYFEPLAGGTERTIQVTAIHDGGVPVLLSVSEIVDGEFTVYGDRDIDFFWQVMAARDIEYEVVVDRIDLDPGPLPGS